MALTLKEANVLKDQARQALKVLSKNQDVIRNDCFPNDAPKKFKAYHRRFLTRLASAGIISKFESSTPNIPWRYRMKNAALLVEIHDSDEKLVRMIWEELLPEMLVEPKATPPSSPEVVPSPSPNPLTAPEPFIPPPTEGTELKELEEGILQLLNINKAVVDLLVWMKDTVHRIDKRQVATERKIDELLEMWRGK